MEAEICPLSYQQEGKSSPWAMLFLAGIGETMAQTTQAAKSLLTSWLQEQVYWGLKEIQFVLQRPASTDPS